jgi:AcrR family transcriptional regulator
MHAACIWRLRLRVVRGDTGFASNARTLFASLSSKSLSFTRLPSQWYHPVELGLKGMATISIADRSSEIAEQNYTLGGTTMAVRGIRNPNSTMQRIMEAAEVEFKEWGFRSSRIARIAERAGTSKQIIYNYYQTRSELRTEFIKKIVEQDRACLASIAFDEQSPTNALILFIDALYDQYLKDGPGLIVESFIAQDISGQNKSNVNAKNSAKLLQNILSRGEGSGEFRHISAGEALVLIVLTCAIFSASGDVAGDILETCESKRPTALQWKGMCIDFILNSICNTGAEHLPADPDAGLEG